MKSRDWTASLFQTAYTAGRCVLRAGVKANGHRFEHLCRDYNCDPTTTHRARLRLLPIRREQKIMNMSIVRRRRIVVESQLRYRLYWQPFKIHTRQVLFKNSEPPKPVLVRSALGSAHTCKRKTVSLSGGNAVLEIVPSRPSGRPGSPKTHGHSALA